MSRWRFSKTSHAARLRSFVSAEPVVWQRKRGLKEALDEEGLATLLGESPLALASPCVVELRRQDVTTDRLGATGLL